MSIIIKHIWRNIKSNRFRSVLIIFSLTLSAAVFYLNLNIGQDANESTRIILQGPYKGYDISVYGDWGDEELITPDCEKTIDAEATGGLYRLRSVMMFYGDIGRFVSEGLLTLEETLDSYSPNTEGQAIMTRTKALHYGIELGETFDIRTGGNKETYTLVAYAKPTDLFYSDNEMLPVVFTYKPTYNANIMLLALEDDSDINTACEKLQNDYVNLTINTLYDADATNERIDSIRQLISIVLLLVIAITFFVVSSTNSLIINYRIPVLGTFRSIGATAWETSFLLIAENVLYGLVASIPGVLFGELFRIFLRTQYLGIKAGDIHISYILLVPAFTVLMNVVISLFAVIRAGRTPIKDLIFRSQSAATKPSLLWGCFGFVLLIASFVIAWLNKSYQFYLLAVELILAVIGTGLCIGPICSLFSSLFSRLSQKTLGGASWLGVRNLSVNRIDRSSALLVSVVIALVMMIYICISSISGFFANYENNYPYDILIKFTNSAEENFSYLERLDGVDSVVYEYWDISDALIGGEEMHVEFVANDGYSNGIEVDASLSENLHSGEIIIDYLFANINDFSVGDTIEIRPSGDEGETFTAKVVGFCESGVFNSSRSTIMMTRRDFFKYIEVEPAIIGISTSRDVYEMIDEINDATSRHDGKRYRVSAKHDYVDAEISEAMGAVKSVSVVPFLTILLALCGLVNNQLISFNQKRMAYAVLYSTAMTRKQLRNMILTELIASFTVGCIVGLLLSVWLTKIMRDIIFVSLAYVPMVITAGQIGLSLLLLLLLMITTAVFPIERLKKMDIIKEIKYE